MRDNRGISLIELIAVMAILAILSGGALISLNYLSFADVDKAMEKVDSSLSKLQMETVGTGYPYSYLAIRWNSTDKSYDISNVTSTVELTPDNWESASKTISNQKKIANEKVMITYSNEEDGSNPIELRDDNPILLISFKPHSGAFLSSCRTIVLEGKSKKSTLIMVAKTGNHYVE